MQKQPKAAPTPTIKDEKPQNPADVKPAPVVLDEKALREVGGGWGGSPTAPNGSW